MPELDLEAVKAERAAWQRALTSDDTDEWHFTATALAERIPELLAELSAIREAAVNPGLLRWCRWPGCWRSYSAATGPVEDPGWIRCDHNSFLLCPHHAASGHQYKTTIQRAPLSLLVFCECGEHADLGGHTNLDDGAAWWTSHVAASPHLSVEGKDTNHAWPTYEELLEQQDEWRREIKDMGAEIERLTDVIRINHDGADYAEKMLDRQSSRIARLERELAARASGAELLLWAADELDAQAAAHNESVIDYTDHLRCFAEQPDRASIVPRPLVSRSCRDGDELVHPAYPHGCGQRVQLSAEVVSQTWPGCCCTWSLFTDTAPATVGITEQNPDCKVHPTKEK